MPASRNVFNNLLTPHCPAFQEICQSTCLLCTPLNTNFLLKSCAHRWVPCWLLTNTAVTSAVTNFRCPKLIAKINNQKNSDMANFICNLYGERHPIFKHRKCQNLWTKLKAIRMQCACIFFHIGWYLQKIEFLISQGIVATCLRWGERCHMGFVANFIRFPVVQIFWESLKIWQSYRAFKRANFFETQCSRLYNEGTSRRGEIFTKLANGYYENHTIKY